MRIRMGDRVLIKINDKEKVHDVLKICWDNNYVAIPCDPQSPAAEFIEKDSNPHIIATDEGVGQPLHDGPGTDAAFIIYSSGTTSDPKGIVLSKKAVLRNAITMMEMHGIKKGSVHATAMSFHHCNAIFMSIIGTYLVDADLVYVRGRWDAASFFNALEQSGAETANVCPTQVVDILRADLPWPPKLRYLFSASAPLMKQTVSDFTNKYGTLRLFQGYGLTETTNFSHVYLTKNKQDYLDEFVNVDIPTVGPLVPGCHTKIRGEEVFLSSPSLYDGYFNHPPRTESPIATGDLGYLNRKGHLILKGRSKETIISGGFKHSTTFLESKYSKFLDGDLCVYAVDDSRLTHSIGLRIEDPKDFKNLKHLAPKPLVVENKKIVRTTTFKPKRKTMGQSLVSCSFDHEYYRSLVASVYPLAKAVVSRKPHNEQTKYLVNSSEKLLSQRTTANKKPFPAVVKVADALLKNLDFFWSGAISGESVIKASRGWKDLNCQAPMLDYAVLTSEILQKQGLLEGDVFEFGAGVGNLSNLIHRKVKGHYTRTDLKLRSSGLGNSEYDWDFHDESPEISQVNTVVGVNAFHCSRTPLKTLKTFQGMLKPGGTLVLGEGNHSEKGWPLDVLFGFLTDWYELQGFYSRERIIELLQLAGFEGVSYVATRAGGEDLGGVIWANNPS